MRPADCRLATMCGSPASRLAAFPGGTYAARIVMSLDERIRIPADSSARITAASLLGGNYLELIPGADEDMMQPGEVIYDTRDPVSLTDLLGKAVFSAANDPS